MKDKNWSYSSGLENGPVTYTGLAMLHGTQNAPEYVLNNDQAYNLLYNLSMSRNAKMAEFEPKNVSNECSSENVSNECSSENVSDSKSLENVSATHLDITFKIRHTADYNHAVLTPLNDGRFMVRSEKPIHGVAPGQFCVIYDSSHHRCYGSGEITL